MPEPSKAVSRSWVPLLLNLTNELAAFELIGHHILEEHGETSIAAIATMLLLSISWQILLLHCLHSEATTPLPVGGHVAIKGIYWNVAQTDWTGPHVHHIGHINLGSL